MTDPTSRLLAQAQLAVQDAEKTLNDAAEQGLDTEGPRASLAAATARLKALEAARDEAASRDLVDLHAGRRQEADRLVAEAKAEIKAAVISYASLIEPEISDLFPETAINLVVEQEENARRQAEGQDFDARLAKLQGRIAELDARKSSLLARRALGDLRDDDAAEVHLIELDREVLSGLVAKLEANPPPRHAENTWATRWKQEVDYAKRQAYGRMVAILDDRMASLIAAARKDFGRLTVSISTRLQAALAGIGVRV